MGSEQTDKKKVMVQKECSGTKRYVQIWWGYHSAANFYLKAKINLDDRRDRGGFCWLLLVFGFRR